MELGALSLSDLQLDPETGVRHSAGERLREIVSYGILADELGLDVFALGEHHSADFAVSSPAVVLAAIAQATGRIRLASAVSVLTTLDPVRLYEDFASLDLLSAGRTEITVGRSAFIEPFGLFGVDPGRYDEVFAENLELLLAIRAQERVTWSGSSRPPLDDAWVAPRATSTSLPVWVGVGGSPASAVRAGELGLPMALGLIGGSFERARQVIDLYRETGAGAGHSPEQLRVAAVSHCHVGATSQGSREAFYPYYREYLRPKTPGGRGWLVDPAHYREVGGPSGALVIGSPQEVVDKLLTERELLGLDRFLGQIDLGGQPKAMVEGAIQLLATEVAPVVRGESARSEPATGLR